MKDKGNGKTARDFFKMSSARKRIPDSVQTGKSRHFLGRPVIFSLAKSNDYILAKIKISRILGKNTVSFSDHSVVSSGTFQTHFLVSTWIVQCLFLLNIIILFQF